MMGPRKTVAQKAEPAASDMRPSRILQSALRLVLSGALPNGLTVRSRGGKTAGRKVQIKCRNVEAQNCSSFSMRQF